MSKFVFVKSYGCQMNSYDSDRMSDIVRSIGYTRIQDMKHADMIILNTCHIRSKATNKVYSDIGRAVLLKEEKDSILVVAGCVAQAEGDIIMQQFPKVDMVVGPQSYHHLPRMIAQHLQKKHQIYTEFETIDKFDSLTKNREHYSCTAFVPIQEGCDKFCTYCVVPYTRGPEFSRPFYQIMDEVKMLLDQGVKEITLLGQNVNGWNFTNEGRKMHFSDLLQSIDQLSVKRLRYSTSHPKHMTDDLIKAHGVLKSLMPWIHLPVQSGSNKILRDMNRGYTKDQYLACTEKLRKHNPNIEFSSDFIVGFPGETHEDFQQTLDLVHEVRFNSYFAFNYSSRSGTPASRMKNFVSQDQSQHRLEQLMEVLENMQKTFNHSCIGKTIEILVEKLGKHKGQLMGRSPWMQPVLIQAPLSLMGQIIKVKILSVSGHSLFGEPISHVA